MKLTTIRLLTSDDSSRTKTESSARNRSCTEMQEALIPSSRTSWRYWETIFEQNYLQARLSRISMTSKREVRLMSSRKSRRMYKRKLQIEKSLSTFGLPSENCCF